MAISSINFAKSSGGSFAHNDRTEKEPNYLLPEEHRLENECNRSAIEAQKMLENLFETAKENYLKTYGQKFQTKFENVHWEAVINLNEEHTIKDVEKLVMEIEKETGFTAVQISIHRDEGRINEKTGHAIYNLHAHVNFFTLDPETGQQLYRRSISNSDREKIRKEHGIPDAEKIPRHLTGVMDKAKLSKLQDITAEVLGMERGERGSTKVRLGHKQHRAVEKEKEKLLEKIEELQKENTELRYNFRETQKLITALEITPEEKKELHRLNTEINKIKSDGEAKDLKISELEEKIKDLDAKPQAQKAAETLINELQEQNEAQHKEIIELNKKVVLGASIELLNKDFRISKAELEKINAEIRERTKPPAEIMEAIYWRNEKDIAGVIQEIAEKGEVKNGSGWLGNGSVETTVVTLDKLNKILLPRIREVTRITLKQLAENIPKIVDTKQVERLENELKEERSKITKLEKELKYFKDKTQEIWKNVKERFKFEGSRLTDEIGNLLDFSKKDPKELDNQRSKGIER